MVEGSSPSWSIFQEIIGTRRDRCEKQLLQLWYLEEISPLNCEVTVRNNSHLTFPLEKYTLFQIEKDQILRVILVKY